MTDSCERLLHLGARDGGGHAQLVLGEVLGHQFADGRVVVDDKDVVAGAHGGEGNATSLRAAYGRITDEIPAPRPT
jgi:hypothetical protein